MRWALLLLLAVLSLALPARAQDWAEPFDWPAAGLLLRLPAAVQVEEDLDAPEIITVRPLDGRSSITLRWWLDVDAAAALQEIFAGGSIESRVVGLLLGQMGLHYEGRSANGELLLVRALDQSEQGAALTISITSPDDDAQALRQTLERIAAGLMRSEDETVLGVVWQREAYAGEGEQAFLEVAGLTLLGSDRLALLEPFAGIFLLDRASGRTIERILLPDGAAPESIATSEDGRIALADALCACVHLWDGAGWSQPLQDFGPEAPRFVAFAGNTLYASDQAEEGAFVRSLSPEGQASRIFFEDFFEQQPRLYYAAERGVLFVLTSDFAVYEAEGAGFSPRALLATVPDDLAATTISVNGQFYVANSFGELLRFDDEGLVDFDMLLQWPDDLVEPLAMPTALVLDDTSGTLFIAEGDGGYARVLALRADSQPQRIGAALEPGMLVAGALEAEIGAQAWPIAAAASTQIITALPLPDSDLALSLQILDESGAVLAESSEISLEVPETGVVPLRFELEAPQTLFLVLTSEAGAGRFQVGLVRTEALDIEGSATQRGMIDAARPLERWRFTGAAGQRITITMSALTGTLDPLLRLLDAEGAELALNDDAENAALGRDAQIFEFRLPASGEYLIEASRFDGAGEYQLDVEQLD